MIYTELFPFIFDLFESNPETNIPSTQIPNMLNSFYTYKVNTNKLMITYDNQIIKIGYDKFDDLYYIMLNVDRKLYDYEVKNYKLYAYNNSDDYVFIDNYMDYNNVNELTEEEILYLSLKHVGLGEYFV